jgi:hypothetical protein
VLAGVDGGSAYAPAYATFEHKKLRSAQNDFNVQFGELRDIRAACGLRISSVRCADASVLIGAEPEQVLAEQVLRWSIESNTFLSPRFVAGGPNTSAAFSAGQAGTPFSFQRLFLPELAGRHGRGVYFDSDMLVFRDVYELFNIDMAGRTLLSCRPTAGRAPQYSVFLVDNAAASWGAAALIDRYRAGEVDYAWLMHRFSFVEAQAADLDEGWNSLEHFAPGRTANLHYTDMHRQPWLSIVNPLASLWCEALFDGLQRDAAVRAAFERSIDAGWVRPSLSWQVDKGQPDPWKIPRAARRLDEGWLPPHLKLQRAAMPSRWHLLRWDIAHRIRRAWQTRNGRRARFALDLARKAFKGAR